MELSQSQKEAQMPKGIPNHLYSFPENYGAEECGMKSLKLIYFTHQCNAYVC